MAIINVKLDVESDDKIPLHNDIKVFPIIHLDTDEFFTEGTFYFRKNQFLRTDTLYGFPWKRKAFKYVDYVFDGDFELDPQAKSESPNIIAAIEIFTHKETVESTRIR